MCFILCWSPSHCAFITTSLDQLLKDGKPENKITVCCKIMKVQPSKPAGSKTTGSKTAGSTSLVQKQLSEKDPSPTQKEKKEKTQNA